LHLVSRSGWRIGCSLGLGFCALIARAEGQEFCVACTEPPAVYRCVIEGARPGGRHPLQMLCVIAMTKEGRHAACSVKGGTVFDCNGPVKRVPWAAYNAAAAEPVPDAPPAAKTSAEPPRTVEEMVKRANSQGVEGASRTWRCISSFFTRCGQ